MELKDVRNMSCNSDGASVLSVCNVGKTFIHSDGSNHRVLENVSFDLIKGEITGLIGRSGCGKTTLARIIMGLETADEGKVIACGLDIGDRSKRNRFALYGKLQYIFQNPYESLSRSMSILGLIAEPLIARGVVKNNRDAFPAVKEILEKVSLNPVERYIDKYPHELSGGERQRIAIARTMILNPEVVIADEPVSMLDASIRLDVIHLLAKLSHENNMTVLLITHDIALAEYCCDRILSLEEGSLCELLLDNL
jgi:peptide/nickel transport system ATP-binding protein